MLFLCDYSPTKIYQSTFIPQLIWDAVGGWFGGLKTIITSTYSRARSSVLKMALFKAPMAPFFFYHFEAFLISDTELFAITPYL